MNAERYDLIVLGSGSAARDGAGKAAREHGARVALIEHWLWGGSCPNVACRPTKAYVVAAELMHDVRHHAAKRGIDLPEPAVRLAQTRKWKDSLRRDQTSVPPTRASTPKSLRIEIRAFCGISTIPSITTRMPLSLRSPERQAIAPS